MLVNVNINSKELGCITRSSPSPLVLEEVLPVINFRHRGISRGTVGLVEVCKLTRISTVLEKIKNKSSDPVFVLFFSVVFCFLQKAVSIYLLSCLDRGIFGQLKSLKFANLIPLSCSET